MTNNGMPVPLLDGVNRPMSSEFNYTTSGFKDQTEAGTRLKDSTCEINGGSCDTAPALLCKPLKDKSVLNGHIRCSNDFPEPAFCDSLTHIRKDSGIVMESPPAVHERVDSTAPDVDIQNNNEQISLTAAGVSAPANQGHCGAAYEEMVKLCEKELESTNKDTAYGTDKFVGKRIGPSGGVLFLRNTADKRMVMLTITEGALKTTQNIYLAVDWNPDGFSPRVKLGPPGTQFVKYVFLHIPVHRGDNQDLLLSRREDAQSAWINNPPNINYIGVNDNVVIQLLSFSDYELVPCTSSRHKLFVYLQQSDIGDSLTIRVYLTKEDSSQDERLANRERGLHGKLEVLRGVLLDTQCCVMVQLQCEEGLEALEQNVTRDVSYTWLTEQEFGTAFLVKFVKDATNGSFRLFLKRGAYEPIIMKLPVCKLKDGLSKPQRAMRNQDRVLYPLDQPQLHFSTKMVEELVPMLDSCPDMVNELAESMEMPMCGSIPNLKLIKYGGSITRCVLDYVQYYCLEQSYDRGDSLRLLSQKLEAIGFQLAAEEVKSYISRCDPQEHSDNTRPSTLDTPADTIGAGSDTASATAEIRDRNNTTTRGRPLAIFSFTSLDPDVTEMTAFSDFPFKRPKDSGYGSIKSRSSTGEKAPDESDNIEQTDM